MRRNCVLVWAGALNTIAKNANAIATTAIVFMSDSLLGFVLLVFEWFGNVVIDTFVAVASAFVQKFC